jgi:hypothetical protein
MRLLLLRTGHHPVFQHWCVRTSMGCYPHFILPIRSSRGFAFTASDHFRPVRTRFRWGFGAEHLNRARDGKSPDHYAKGTPSPHPLTRAALTACRRVVSGSVSSPWWGFFPSFARATGFTIGRQGVLSLAGWAPLLQAEFHVFGPTQVPDGRENPSHTGLSPAVV